MRREGAGGAPSIRVSGKKQTPRAMHNQPTLHTAIKQNKVSTPLTRKGATTSILVVRSKEKTWP